MCCLHRFNKMSKVQFNKIRDVKTPYRANEHDAGTDFFVPNYNLNFLESLLMKNNNNNLHYEIKLDDNNDTQLYITIPPAEQIMIPSGIRVWIHDKSTFLQATNKSGVASKFHLDVMANTVDADYQGEVHINLCNNGNAPVTVQTGQKLVQFIQQYYIPTEWEQISTEEYNSIEESDRGDGMAGSTGILK